MKNETQRSETSRKRETVGVEEAARRLGIVRELAYRLAAEGSLPGVLRLGHRYVVSVAKLDEVLGRRAA